jgi:putative hydrolase
VAEGIRTRQNPLDDGGVVALFATPDQRDAMDRVGGLMSLLEGHGDVTMDRAAVDQVPSADRFARVLRSRRKEMNLAAKLLQRLIGLEAKLAQYEQGERFIEAVEAVGGPELLNRAFERPENLPTLAEIREPSNWLRRVGRPAA